MIFIQKNNQNNKDDFWIGFSDLMTGLMLVFIILSITFMTLSQKNQKQLEKFIEKIEQAKKEAEKAKKRLEELIKQAKKDKEKLEKMRKNIIVILSKQLASENIEVVYNAEKGTITIAQDILFLRKKSNLNNKGKKFIQVFSQILDEHIFHEKDYQKLIKYIHIEGYASREGSVEYNFQLSFERSKNVWLYMTSNKLKNQAIMKQKLNIVSRGEIEANQINIDTTNRKVIFRFEFYDTYNKIFKDLSAK